VGSSHGTGGIECGSEWYQQWHFEVASCANDDFHDDGGCDVIRECV
jgi:hypothetical protein